MGLRKRIQDAQRRKAIRFSLERLNGQILLAKRLEDAKDGGLLIHAEIERVGA